MSQSQLPNAKAGNGGTTSSTDLPSKIDRFDGKVRWLSNFWELETPIVDELGVAYPTTEHYFQAAKTMDKTIREAIAAAPSPGASKRMGRTVKLRSDWEWVRHSIMETALRKKFADAALRKKLLATGEARLIEGNTWGDTFWGVDVKKGGLNELGKLLERLRKEFREHDGVGAASSG
jgi:ribA/ribD-fused uncharacterized protein